MRNRRHTYSTLLHALGTTSAVQKELLRHANIQTTLNLYTQAVSEAKREAASKVLVSCGRIEPTVVRNCTFPEWRNLCYAVCNQIFRGVAQPGSAFALGARGR